MPADKRETHMADTRRIPSVQARWDTEARVWVAVSDDVPGLAAEAASLDQLFQELKGLIPELLALNGMADGDLSHFKLVAASDGAGLDAA
jgi:predicted RNase H-like HicB family nuclease